MDAYGELQPQRALGLKGKMFKHGPLYKRSISLKDLNIHVQPRFRVNWTKKDDIVEGYLKFAREDDRGCIQSIRVQGKHSTCTFLDKACTDHNGANRFKVVEGFYPALRRLLRKGTDWGVDFAFNGLGEFAPNLMEWTEQILEKHEHLLRQSDIYGLTAASCYPYSYNTDVWRAFCELWGPLTNTLHHAGGELGISLNDMKQIGGLPILGEPYEEFLPPNEQLSDLRKFPATVLELLRIHANLCKHYSTEEVSWWKWLAHFYRGDKVYDSYGETNIDRSMSSDQAAEKESLPLVVSETGNLAAFLALLLSRFVLPQGAKTVRPETFVIACFLAEGRKISLAPTTLGHIYHGLNKMATHPTHPGRANPSFGIHFVIGWIAEYFPCLYRCRPDNEFPVDYPRMVRHAGVVGNQLNIHQSRSVLRHSKHVLYRRIPFGEEVGVDNLDSEEMSNAQFERLLCIRSSVLPIRVDGSLLMEPYYPNRFARQFGFAQGIPSNFLKFDNLLRKRRPLEDIAHCYNNLFQKNTGALFHIPQSNQQGKCCWSFCSWWVATSAPYLSQSLHKVNVTLTKRETHFHFREKNYVIDDVRKIIPGLKGAVKFSHVSRSSSEEITAIVPSKRKIPRDPSPDVNFKRKRNYRQSGLIMDDRELRSDDDFDSTLKHNSKVVIELDETDIVAESTKAGPSKVKSNSMVCAIPSMQDMFPSSQREYLRSTVISGVNSIAKAISHANSSGDPLSVQDDVYVDLNILRVTAKAAGVDDSSFSWITSQIDDFFKGAAEVNRIESEVKSLNEISSNLSICNEELASDEKELFDLLEKSLAAKDRQREISDLETKL